MFALFFSEFVILLGGFDQRFAWAAYIMAALLIQVFIAFLNQFRVMYYGPDVPSAVAPARISAWCVTPMVLALAPLLVFGFWWPTAFWAYFEGAARALGMVAS